MDLTLSVTLVLACIFVVLFLNGIYRVLAEIRDTLNELSEALTEEEE